MALTVGVARNCPLFSLGFDSLAPVTGAICQDAKLAGYRFIGRYLHNLTSQERDVIFANGLAIWPLTYAPTQEILNAATGAKYATQALHQASSLWMPPAIHITLDLESPMAGSDCAAHVNAAARTLMLGGQDAALYVGGPEPLNGAQLYALAVNRYAKGGGQIPEPQCGWCIIQAEPLDQQMFGTRVDVDFSKADYEGRVFTMWWGK